MAVLIDSVQAATKDQVSYLVDMAKADALDLLGENRQALELVDRHVRANIDLLPPHGHHCFLSFAAAPVVFGPRG